MKLRMPLAAVALVLALAGCAAIPNSGAVQTGNVIDTETQVQGVYQPSGPQTGATQGQIVSDFVQAALDPQNDYATARKFLASTFRQKWNPNASVTIQRGVGTASVVTGSADQFEYSMRAVAHIDANGSYTEEASPEPEHLDVGLVKEDGQWRIAKVNDGIAISESTFDGVFAAHPLYFFEPGYRYLVPDVRWFPTTDGVTTRIANSLLAGPASWLGGGVLVTAFPPGTTLDDVGVVVESAVATVDLSTEAKLTTTARDRARMQQQMTASLTSVSNVQSVALTVGGVDLAAPGSATDSSSVQPSVNAASLVLDKNTFGFTIGDPVRSIPGISSKALALGMLGASYTDSSKILAARTESGVAVLSAGGDALLVDPRTKLIDPSIDNYGFVWSVQAQHVSSLRIFASDGSPQGAFSLASLGGDDPRVVSLDVSRDGSRLLLYLDGDGGPRLVVAGIIRGANNVPLGLGPDPVSLPVTAARPVDATWESDRSVAAISGSGTATTITEFGIGGPSAVLGVLAEARQIVGGNGGQSGLRVLDAAGIVYRGTGTGSSWREAGYNASFIATQQPG